MTRQRWHLCPLTNICLKKMQWTMDTLTSVTSVFVKTVRSINFCFLLLFQLNRSLLIVSWNLGKCLLAGLLDISDCYYGFPIALSYPHFLDSDEQLVNNVIGSRPNRTEHESYFMIQPVSICTATDTNNNNRHNFLTPVLPLFYYHLKF